jgi:hypothetical protein
MPRFPPSDWLVNHFRLTAFPVPGAITRSPEWREAVSGASPDETTSNPKKGSSVVSGSFEPGKLVLRLEPDRVDWLLVLADSVAEELLISPHRAYVRGSTPNARLVALYQEVTNLGS